MKPRKPQSEAGQRAPRANQPAAPFPSADNSVTKPATAHASPYSSTAGPAKSKPAAPRAGKQERPRPEPRSQSSSAQRPKNDAPGAWISRRAAERLRAGHVWVYASDIESLVTGTSAGDQPPALLPVADNRGLLLGTGLYSPTSQIALRLVARNAIDEAAWLKLLSERLRAAIRRRKPFLSAETNACRLCFSEADELPGIVIDMYAGLVILQILARGLDSAAVRSACVRVLTEELEPLAIVERPDPRMRELESLSAPALAPLWTAGGATEATSTLFRLNGLTFHYDAGAGQKTGAFLDQRSNYAAALQWARTLGVTGKALDVCCYQGGFALHLAQACAQVTGVDTSRASLEVAELNLAANRTALSAAVDWVEADAFELMRDWSDARKTFDVLVVDPPAFAKTQRAVEGALRGYKELNLRALKMANPGALLVTCSCSHHIAWTDLEGTLASAAADAHRRVRLIERRGASPDHPVVLNLPETEYLKCLVLQVE